jgi:hypothetical protein
MDAAGTVAEALVVDGERIAFVGSAAEAAAYAPGADTVDLAGRTILPGFVDAHDHLSFTGAELAQLDARSPGVSSIADLVRVVAEAAERTPDGVTIRAAGMNDRAFAEGRLPTRWDLDAATRVHPVLVTHISGHHALANTMALERRGVTDATADPPGGHLARDERGRLTGYAYDAAQQLIVPPGVDIGHHGPGFHDDAPLEEVVGDIDRACRAYVAVGITSVCDAQVTRRELEGYAEARRRRLLTVRTTAMPISSQQAEYAALGISGRLGDDRLAIGPMKFYADGALTGGTACFTQPYGVDGEFTGSLYWGSEAEFRAAVVAAHVGGWQVGIHAQGDRALDRVLDAFEAALAADPRPDPRFRIEHGGGPRPDQVARMARLGVIVIGQPRYLWDAGDDWRRTLGVRAERLQPYQEFQDAGVRFVISTDAPVASYRPMDTLESAILRRTSGGSVLGRAHGLDIETALRAYTIEAARSYFVDDAVGSLEPGKLADLVVLDTDPVQTPPERLAGIGTVLTLIGGEVVHRA